MEDKTANSILDEAREFMKNRGQASWADYNYFKQKLLSSCCYGHEKELADILNL